MQFKLEIDLDNAAYDNLGWELGENLEKVISRIGQGCTSGKVQDSNGNTVGQWAIESSIHDSDCPAVDGFGCHCGEHTSC